MALRVEQTTDNKYIGVVAPIDPRDPPSVINTPDGASFDPVSWTEFEPGLWRIRNSNYCLIAREI